jgi:regulator of nucleoside diphosphate kinase
MKSKIYINTNDLERLTKCIEELEEFGGLQEKPHVAHLKSELERATTLKDPKKTPTDVITMHSRVRLLDEGTGKSQEYTLVYPNESSPEERKVSVLAPLGVAMLGHRAGKSFEVKLPARVAKYTVEEITYQPEAAGDFHL